MYRRLVAISRGFHVSKFLGFDKPKKSKNRRKPETYFLMTGLGLDEKAVLLYVVCIRCPAGYPCTWVAQVRGKAVRLILYQLGGGQDRGIRPGLPSSPAQSGAHAAYAGAEFSFNSYTVNRLFDICVGVAGKVTKKWLPATGKLPPSRLNFFLYNTICLSAMPHHQNFCLSVVS